MPSEGLPISGYSELKQAYHPGGNPWTNLRSISPRCHPILVAFVWDCLKKPLICPWLASGVVQRCSAIHRNGSTVDGTRGEAKGAVN